MDIVRWTHVSVGAHPAVRGVDLVGSRARGDSTAFSDWDFEIATDDFPSVSASLPSLVRPLHPLAQQWDRLSRRQVYMLVLTGPTKVDYLFDSVHDVEPPWSVTADRLPAIDDHFWDWVLWLLSKETAGRTDVVVEELSKMFDHLLQPMGVRERPADTRAAVDAYVAARATQERRHGVLVPRTLENEVGKAFNRGRTGRTHRAQR